MFSARKGFGKVPKKRRGWSRFRPRAGIRLWLTALFVLITALAVFTAYAFVSPRIEDTLRQTSEANFSQVGEGFVALVEELREENRTLTPEVIESYATSRGVQWGVVLGDGGQIVNGTLDNWDQNVVERAVASGRPQQSIEPIETGEREGQELATYAAPVNLQGQRDAGAAVVFVRYITQSDSDNVTAAIRSIERIALLAGALALLIAGVAGYLVADQISRRISRLGLAAQRLARGNFDERIKTRLRDEVGSLGETFNSMAASLQAAFRQIQVEKERGQTILNGMTDAVVGVDRDLNTTFLNQRARELLAASDQDFQRRLYEILAKARFAGEPVTEPEVHSAEKIIEVRAAPLEDGALAILRDVTEERRIEKAKAEFIANASHELKTPLFALSGYLEMLEDEEDEEVRKSFLQDMKLQTERLQNLARTLLDLSRLDSGAVTFRLEDVDLEELLYEARSAFRYAEREIRVRAEEGVPQVRTDPIQLQRVISILLDNAIKYSPEDEPVELELSRNGEKAEIRVIDHGCGIPEQDVPHIFERFYRAHGSSRADGTGLGLALAHEISTHLGAEIRVQSEPDAGSTFTLALPLNKT
ncbi:sensor histidine kinase [Rubrobacter taiwanensis]|jgi:signal transduction histidine kinase|uniref:Sensor-like histidine kinase SenX3 n=1 Tax=Rubrobacter taiwanensis TaxID=185139 RepID=A0A4R1BFX5_9ACTN|nr:sensor histidine kinase [Rubrobacter taiwanensis]